jgi:hypothetical protein
MTKARLISSLAALLLSVSPAAAFDTLNINLGNGDTSPLLVEVFDENTPSENKVYSDTLNAGAHASLVVTAADGKGHVKWTAQTSDKQKCGSGDVTGLDSGADLTVSAASSC